MKHFNKYISEFLVKGHTQSPSEEDEFTKDMRELWKLTSDDIGSEEIHELLSYLGDFKDEDYEDFYYKWHEGRFQSLLRCIVNYDMICITKQGKIDIKNSNHQDIAEIMNKYSSPQMIKKVYDSFVF